jgi:hypothetical protein
MAEGISIQRFPEMMPKLVAGAGISIAFGLFRKFMVAKNRPASLKDGKEDQVYSARSCKLRCNF